jgi:Grx4 family monothiol glutaredoxin
MSTIKEILTQAEYEEHIGTLPKQTLLIISFYAPWAAPCAQMNIVLSTLAASYPLPESGSAPETSWLSINAEEVPDVSDAYNVTAVPFLALVRDKKTLETVSGSDANKVRTAIEKQVKSAPYVPDAVSLQLQAALAESKAKREANVKPALAINDAGSNGAKDLSAYAPGSKDSQTAPEYSSNGDATAESTESKEDLTQRLTELVKAAPVMLFMKGTPSAPQCGFSRQLVALLRENSVRYGFFNILADDEVRQGLKEFADWPTFPQLWVGGELVGGLDIVSYIRGSNPMMF